MKKAFALLLTILLPTLLAAQIRPLVIRHATLIDMRSEQPKPNMTVVVSGNRISKIGKNIKIPKDAEVVEASGKFLIPGLWDMHVHALTDRHYSYFFPMLIANGVTGVRDLGSNLSLAETLQIRQSVIEGVIVGPRFGALTGRILDGAQTRLNIAAAIATADEGRRTVRDYKMQGADFVKPYNLLSREIYLAILEEAKRQKIPVAGHVPFSMTAAEVSDLGQTSIEHNTDVLLSCASNETQLRAEMATALKTETEGLLGRFEAKAAANYDERKAAALFARFKRNDTWSCPTNVVYRPINFVSDENRLLGDSRLKYIPAATRGRWRTVFKQRLNFISGEADRKLRYRMRAKIAGAMHRAGVRLLAGTDAPSPYIYPGFSLHDELELMVEESGLSPFEALETATLNPAKFTRREKDLGTIERGKLADLVLLDANPLLDISNTRTINAVVVNGRLFDRNALNKMLADVEAAAEQK